MVVQTIQSVAFKVCHGKTWFISWLCHFHTRLDTYFIHFILVCTLFSFINLDTHQLKTKVNVADLHLPVSFHSISPDVYRQSMTLDTGLQLGWPLFEPFKPCLLFWSVSFPTEETTKWKGLKWEDLWLSEKSC